MSLFGQTKRHVPNKKDPRRSPLPIFVPDPEKKYDLSAPLSPTVSRYFTQVYIPLPRLSRSSNSSEHLLSGTGYSPRGHGKPSRRYIKLYLPIPPRLYARFPRIPTTYKGVLAGLLLLGMLFVLLGFRRRGPAGRNTWTPPFTDPDTLVLSPEEVAMIWEWEVLSGHHPSLHGREFSLPMPADISAGTCTSCIDIEEPRRSRISPSISKLSGTYRRVPSKIE